MPQDKKNDQEYLVIGSDGKEELNVPVLVNALLTKLMGTAIDFGRMAIQHPEAFKQFERSVKDQSYNLMKFGSKILAEHGHEDISEK